MPGRLATRILAEFHELKAHPAMRRFRHVLEDPHLFHITQHSISWGMAFGLAANWIPLPIQSVLAALGCIWKRGNIPLAVALVWLSNPVTLVPMVLLAYNTGAIVLGLPPGQVQFEPSWEWLTQAFKTSLHNLVLPFVLGSVIWGFISGFVGYFGVRILWHARGFRNFRAALHRAHRAQRAINGGARPNPEREGDAPPGDGC